MNKFINIGILLLLVLFISFRINVACNQLDRDSIEPASDLTIPSEYEGVLPCASCPGIEYTLRLDFSRFQENNIYIDQSDQQIDIDGNWEIRADTLFLISDEELIHKRFLIKNESLTLIDNEGERISSLNLSDN